MTDTRELLSAKVRRAFGDDRASTTAEQALDFLLADAKEWERLYWLVKDDNRRLVAALYGVRMSTSLDEARSIARNT